jgi:hypothetical protein
MTDFLFLWEVGYPHRAACLKCWLTLAEQVLQGQVSESNPIFEIRYSRQGFYRWGPQSYIHDEL